MKNIKSVLILMMLQSSLVGCASFGQTLKDFLSGGSSRTKKTGISQQANGKIDKNKNYRRTDHKTLQERSKLGPGSGSLWIERGQGSYLFAQNTNRLIGDLVNIEIEGQAKKQIETKVAVIQELIDKIKAQTESRKLAAQAKAGKDGAKQRSAAPPAASKAEDKFEIKTVPSTITEIQKDGSYLIEGDQPFMIGKREYKLKVSGIVRQDDFNDQGISAETLLDPKFDIVTNRKKR